MFVEHHVKGRPVFDGDGRLKVQNLVDEPGAKLVDDVLVGGDKVPVRGIVLHNS